MIHHHYQFYFFFFNDPATTDIYTYLHTLSLHDALPILHEQDLEQRPELTQKVVSGIVQAQAWIQENRQETARILAKDNPQRYTPHTYETLAQVLVPELLDTAQYDASGAIVNKDSDEKRNDFQHYPFHSSPAEQVRTQIGRASWRERVCQSV